MWVQNSFADFPTSRLLPDGSGVQVAGRYLNPEWTTGALWIAAALNVWYFYLNHEKVVTFIDFLQPAVTCLLIAVPLGWLWGQKKVNIQFRPGTIRAGWSNYSRQAQIEFRIDDHHKTFNPPYHRVYATMIEVVMQYGERRIILATMRRKDLLKAQALMLRLSTINADLPGFMRMLGAPAPTSGPVQGPFGPKPDIS